ncbi:MAG: CehA/McbA family metallohydrolase, partial [Terriglobales bacterium]
RTRLAGETDFPCITDERVGQARTYVKVPGKLTYRSWLDGLKAGRSYVSDGRAHLMDFSVNSTAVGAGDDEVDLVTPAPVHVHLRVSALLDAMPHPEIQSRPLDQKPYWTIERARIGATNKVPVELVVNGRVAARQEVVADGTLRDVTFDVPLARSSWIAARILPAAHTNPIFVLVNHEPIRSRASAEWCLRAVQQCWTQKSPLIKAAEQAAARATFTHAEEVYRTLIEDSAHSTAGRVAALSQRPTP